MDALQAIHARKSIRAYETTHLSRELLESIINDAIQAPSAQNRQPWHFYVVSSKKQRDAVANITKQALIKYAVDLSKLSSELQQISRAFYTDLGGCQHIIFIFIRKDSIIRDANIMSVSAATQNIMISATARGLGTCWVGSFRGFEKEVKKIVGAKKEEELAAAILIGLPKKDYIPMKRSKKTLSEVLTFI